MMCDGKAPLDSFERKGARGDGKEGRRER